MKIKRKIIDKIGDLRKFSTLYHLLFPVDILRQHIKINLPQDSLARFKTTNYFGGMKYEI